MGRHSTKMVKWKPSDKRITSMLFKKKTVFLNWSLLGQSNLILCPTVNEKHLVLNSRWEQRLDLWLPHSETRGLTQMTLSGSLVCYIRLFWIWSVPKIITCANHKQMEKKSQSVMGCKSHLWYWKATTRTHRRGSLVFLQKSWERRRQNSGRCLAKLRHKVTVITSERKKTGWSK